MRPMLLILCICIAVATKGQACDPWVCDVLSVPFQAR